MTDCIRTGLTHFGVYTFIKSCSVDYLLDFFAWFVCYVSLCVVCLKVCISCIAAAPARPAASSAPVAGPKTEPDESLHTFLQRLQAPKPVSPITTILDSYLPFPKSPLLAPSTAGTGTSKLSYGMLGCHCDALNPFVARKLQFSREHIVYVSPLYRRLPTFSP